MLIRTSILSVVALAGCSTAPGPSSAAPPRADHRGLFQAQGNDIKASGNTKSTTWGQDKPLTKTQALDKLEALWNELTDAEKKNRKNTYGKVQEWIEKCPEKGIEAVKKMTWPFQADQYDGVDDHTIRIDIELIAGIAFVSDGLKHSGKMMATGKGVNQAVSWNLDVRPQFSRAHGFLDDLKRKLGTAQQKEFEGVFKEAHGWFNGFSSGTMMKKGDKKEFKDKAGNKILIEVTSGEAFKK